VGQLYGVMIKQKGENWRPGHLKRKWRGSFTGRSSPKKGGGGKEKKTRRPSSDQQPGEGRRNVRKKNTARGTARPQNMVRGLIAEKPGGRKNTEFGRMTVPEPLFLQWHLGPGGDQERRKRGRVK